MSSSGADASDLDAALALLSGPDLVAHLRTTYRSADYDAAARVLGDRDRWLAQAEAKLAKAQTGLKDLTAEVQAVQERYELEAARRRPSSRSSCGAIAIAAAAAAPRVGRRAEQPARKGAIELCTSSDDDELQEGEEFRPDAVGVSRKRKEASRAEEGPRAGVSCKRKASASKGDEGRRAGVSCKRKASESKGDEGRRAGVSCKRKEPASACSPDDEDDKIPLSQLMKKRRRANPLANGVPKKGHGDVQANSAGPLGLDRPVISAVNRGMPDAVAEHMVGSLDDPKVAAFLQGTGNGKSGKNGGLPRTMPSPPPTGSTAGNNMRKNCSKPDGSEGQARIGEKQGPVISPVNRGIPKAVAEHMFGSPDDPKVAVFVQRTGNGQSGKNGGFPNTMPSPPPTGSTAGTGNNPHKNWSKSNGSEGQARIGEKQCPVAGVENDAPVQVRTPSVTNMTRRIVGSARVVAETPMEHTDFSLDGTISVVLKSIEGQEKANGGVHKTEESLETNGTGDKASIVLKDTREQGNADGQVLNTSPCRIPVDNYGGRTTTSDKPVSATLQRKSQLALHSSEQKSVESSLPETVTRHWKSSSAVFKSCLGNKKLCMQAACALYRQRKFTTQPTEGRRSGCSGLSKFDAHRLAVLAEFLLDGGLQGPLKRTAEDLEKRDSTGHDFIERVVLQCSEQLFSIYRNKDDKYFH